MATGKAWASTGAGRYVCVQSRMLPAQAPGKAAIAVAGYLSGAPQLPTYL